MIPNKVFQALACGRPLVTRSAPAYPEALHDAADGGIRWVPAADATALADAVAALAMHPERLGSLGAEARRSYERHFSAPALTAQLRSALSALR
ncbi:MAG: glycosyltransferase [Chromatiales bacterium]|nr:glycosyltransferase [Chromatiales bacterium]